MYLNLALLSALLAFVVVEMHERSKPRFIPPAAFSASSFPIVYGSSISTYGRR